MHPRPVRALALITALAMTTVASPISAVGETTLAGCIRAGVRKPRRQRSSRRFARVSLSPTATKTGTSAGACFSARSAGVRPITGTPFIRPAPAFVRSQNPTTRKPAAAASSAQTRPCPPAPDDHDVIRHDVIRHVASFAGRRLRGDGPAGHRGAGAAPAPRDRKQASASRTGSCAAPCACRISCVPPRARRG